MTFEDILEIIISLIENACVLFVAAFFIKKATAVFKLEKSNKNPANIIAIGLIGALFCVYASLSGVDLGNGALINIRDTGALLAGALGGPIAGIIAGVFGGVHRFLLGGDTYLACSISTVIAGLAAGILSMIFGKKLIRWYWGTILAVCMEIIHLCLVAFLSVDGVATALILAIPMIIGNTVSLSLLFLIFSKSAKTPAPDKK